jgi:hypothetical protein
MKDSTREISPLRQRMRVANAFYVIGAHDALGYSPFGIDDTARLANNRLDSGLPGTGDVAHTALAQG